MAPNVVKRIRGEEAVARAVDGVEADAALMWSWVFPIIGQRRHAVVPIPASKNVIDPLVVVPLTTGQEHAGAERLVRFLQSPRAQRLLAGAKLAGGRRRSVQ